MSSAAYSRRYPAICQQTDADPETGCREFDIEKDRISFRLTVPYNAHLGKVGSYCSLLVLDDAIDRICH